jgi:cobalamin biosynthesis protein CobD/CbiB
MTEIPKPPETYGTLRWSTQWLSAFGDILMLAAGGCLLIFMMTILFATGGSIPMPWNIVLPVGSVGLGIALFGIGASMKTSAERVLLEIDNADNLEAIRQALSQPQDRNKIDLQLRAIASTSSRTAAAVETLASTVKRPS